MYASLPDWKSLHEHLAGRVAALEAELLALRAAAPPFPERERESLLKLVIGMAISGYKYDPRAVRNPATSDIAGDLRLLGIPLDDDTVRKYLVAGRDLVPPPD